LASEVQLERISVDSPDIINSIYDGDVVCGCVSFGIGNAGRKRKIRSRTRERGCWKGWQLMIIIVFVLQFIKAAI